MILKLYTKQQLINEYAGPNNPALSDVNQLVEFLKFKGVKVRKFKDRYIVM